MPNCSRPSEHAAKDLRAMDQVNAFVANNPQATYHDVTKEIDWYFDDPDFSPWIVDWIDYVLNESR